MQFSFNTIFWVPKNRATGEVHVYGFYIPNEFLSPENFF